MLVLTRKVEQSIVCPELGIKIKILKKCANGGVSIGIEAPRHLTFHREEIQRKIDGETAVPSIPSPVRTWEKTKKVNSPS
jgi:carbon storage regulator CsrA